jgi:hypothetical protein
VQEPEFCDSIPHFPLREINIYRHSCFVQRHRVPFFQFATPEIVSLPPIGTTSATAELARRSTDRPEVKEYSGEHKGDELILTPDRSN